MSKYETYKPSDVVWIGEVPIHWRIQRLKDLVLQKITDGPHETPELVDDEDSIPFISAEAITENGINYDARGGNISAEQDKIYSLKCKPKKHDIFIVKSGSTTGRIGYVEIDLNFNIWSPLALVRSNKQTSSRFLFHYLSSDCIQRQIQNTWSFGTQPNIGMGVIERLRLSMPPTAEQFTIANYLDHQTQKIDRLIANKKAQAEKLKELRQIEINNAVTKGLNPKAEMKDSDIEWLGKIPKHWEVKRLKNVADINSSKQEVKYDDVKNLEVVFLPMENVSENGVIDNSDKRKASEVWEGFTYFKKNDVIIAKITPCFENGKGAWLSSLESEFGFGSTEFHTVRGNKNRLDNQYFFFVTKSDVFMKIGEAFMTGSAGQKRVSTNFVLTFKLAFPPIKDQLQIAEYLQERTAAIDKLIMNIDEQIEKLQELRKIKIYEAVTGKIKVNAYVEATA